MQVKIKKIASVIICLFVSGAIGLWIGFAYGEELASFFSRPLGADSWSTSEGMVMACTYVPVILGFSFIILAMIFCTLVFIEWIKNNN